MNQTNKKFARAFVSQNSGHDFTSLKEICNEIVFVSNGWDTEEQLLPTVVAGLLNFSPKRDVIVPVGNVYINLLVGVVATEMSREWGYYHVALYRDNEYHIQTVDTNVIGELINVSRLDKTI